MSFDVANLAAGPARVVSSRIERERTLWGEGGAPRTPRSAAALRPPDPRHPFPEMATSSWLETHAAPMKWIAQVRRSSEGPGPATHITSPSSGARGSGQLPASPCERLGRTEKLSRAAISRVRDTQMRCLAGTSPQRWARASREDGTRRRVRPGIRASHPSHAPACTRRRSPRTGWDL